MTDFRFYAHDVLTQQPLGEIEPTTWSFSDPMWGGGTCEFTAAIPRRSDVLKRRTQPDAVALYVKADDTFVWGGVINYRARRPGIPLLSVKAQQWESWLYDQLFPNAVYYVGGGQHGLANDMLNFAVNRPGTPNIQLSERNGGTARDFNLPPWKSVGEGLDLLGNRPGGFEWSIGVRTHITTGDPELFLELWDIGATRSTSRLLRLDATDGRNNVNIGEWAEDSSGRKTRVWATGEGSPPDQAAVKDEAPGVAQDQVLLREMVVNFPSERDRTYLYDHAKKARLALEQGELILPVDISADNVTNFRTGDRARLVVNDEWEMVDISGVRIFGRGVSKAKRNSDAVVSLRLDLRDVA